MGDTGSMRVSADFTTVPDEFAARAPETNLVDGVPVVSFPFYVEGLEPGMHYLHWELVDPDSIPVCGFEWIHWAVANVPVDALMFDFNDSKALQIPPDFSRAMPSMIPEALQGRNSSAGSMVGGTNPQVTMRYNGPQPPDAQHGYVLRVWATAKPLPNLRQGFWLNELLHALPGRGEADGRGVDQGGIVLAYAPAPKRA